MLVDLCSVTPDGVVCFFTSYSYMEQTINQWDRMLVLERLQKHKLIFIETKDVVETTLALNNFKQACDCGRGAVCCGCGTLTLATRQDTHPTLGQVFFSVARGKVAEGIDFDRHYGRLVLLFGVPFQYTQSHVLRARLAYLQERFHIRESYFLSFDAVRQVRRCVAAAGLLLDH